METLSKKTMYKQLLHLTNSAVYEELIGYYQSQTFMDVVGISRLENSHSNFLAWLFDGTKDHQLGFYAVKRLLETVMLAFSESDFSRKANTKISDKLNFFHKDNILLHNSIRSLSFSIEEINVVREWNEWADNSRLDIWLEVLVSNDYTDDRTSSRIIIAIENKVSSSENVYKDKKTKKDQYQTCKYWELLKNTYLGKTDIVVLPVFLVPIPQTEYKEYLNGKAVIDIKDVAKSPQFFTLNYQYLLDGVLQPSYDKVKNPHSKLILEDYIKCLGRAIASTEDIENGSEKKNKDNAAVRNFLVLATTQKERVLVKKLWDTNQEALKQIINAGKAVEGQNDQVQNVFSANQEEINYKIHYMKNKEFYRSFLYTLKEVLGNQKASSNENQDVIKSLEEYIQNVNKGMNKKPFFLYTSEDSSNNIFRYESQKRKPRSLGWLAHVLIQDWIKHHPLKEDVDKCIEKLVETLNSKKQESLWIGMVCVRRKKFESKQKEIFENRQNGLTNETEKLYAPSRYFIDDCLKLFDDNVKAFSEMIMDGGSINANNNNPIKTGDNWEDDVYVAHWWGENDIIKLLEVLEDFYNYDANSRKITRK